VVLFILYSLFIIASLFGFLNLTLFFILLALINGVFVTDGFVERSNMNYLLIIHQVDAAD